MEFESCIRTLQDHLQTGHLWLRYTLVLLWRRAVLLLRLCDRFVLHRMVHCGPATQPHIFHTPVWAEQLVYLIAGLK